MKLKSLLVDARKALVTLGAIESTAVGLGLLNQTQDALITSILGVLTTGLVYRTRNGKKPLTSVTLTKDTVEIKVDGKPVVSLPKVVPNPNAPEEAPS
jgi:hypothetical protein